jgi:hypothetical protein
VVAVYRILAKWSQKIVVVQWPFLGGHHAEAPQFTSAYRPISRPSRTKSPPCAACPVRPRA